MAVRTTLQAYRVQRLDGETSHIKGKDGYYMEEPPTSEHYICEMTNMKVVTKEPLITHQDRNRRKAKGRSKGILTRRFNIFVLEIWSAALSFSYLSTTTIG
jgi:hypothetical protein